MRLNLRDLLRGAERGFGMTVARLTRIERTILRKV
jgi:hypothetical protein